MRETKLCQYCEVPMHHRRSDAKHCSSSCRSNTWRMQQQRKVSVKIVLTVTQFESLKNESNSLGLMLNELIVAKSVYANNQYQSL